jgi:hypothetical protein
VILADTNILSTFARVGTLLRQIETEQGMVIKNKDAIFE